MPAPLNVIDRAHHVSSGREAARLRDEWEFQLAMGDVAGDREAAFEEALSVLNDRFPQLSDMPVGEYGDDVAAKKNRLRGRPGTSANDRAARAAAPRSSKPPRSGRKGSSGRRSAGGTRVRRAFGQTGIPGAASSATGLTLQLLGFTIGLSLLYLLITNADRARRGQSAVELFASGVSAGVHRLIAPVDPLTPSPTRSGSPSGRGRGGRPARPGAMIHNRGPVAAQP